MFKERSNIKELLDDLDLSGNELYKNLKEIEQINNRLGGNKVVIEALDRLNLKNPAVIMDVGCGAGDTLRALEKINDNASYIGVDANKNITQYAQSMLNKASSVKIISGNCFDENLYKEYKPDVVIFSLFLHHLTNAQINELITLVKKYSSYIIINDLHRNCVSYFGFKLLMRLFKASYITKHDGSISILRGFKKREWSYMLEKINGISFEINWRWAFRHQIIINCN